MVAANIVSICNRSLLSIGSQSQISSLNEGSTQADACSTLFTPTFQALARTAYWNCLRKQAVLSLIAAAAGTTANPQGTTLPLPPSPWLYSYILPSDCLQARYIVPSWPVQGTSPPIFPISTSTYGNLPGLREQIPFQVAYATDANNNPLTIILTNQVQAQLVYTVDQQNPQIWDSSFQAAMVASLAAYLVPALSLNMPLIQVQIQIAERIIGEARIRDGDEGSTQQDHTPDWIVARNVGGGIEYACGGSGQYSNMAW